MESNGSNRLQLENTRMEERLMMLKQLMSVEKAQREASVKSRERSYWESGRRGPLSVKKNSNNNTTVTTEKLVKNKKRALKVSVLTGKEADPVLKDKIQCGQCDQYRASMMCIECVENYCNMCFVKFHHKGSLSKHHVRPLAKSMMKEFTGKSPHRSDTNTSLQLSVGTGEEKEGQSLLEGSYDEAASAKMFEEALKSWRNSSKQDETPPKVTSVESVSCGVQASTSEDSNRISMDALESMTSNSSNASSYFEKLLLKRVKANPSFFTSMTPLSSPAPRIAPEPLVDEDHDHTAASVMISPYNIFYSSDCEHDLLNIESTDNVSIPITPSTVSVEELNPMPSHTASSNLSLQPASSEEHATKEDNLIVSNEAQSIEAGRQYTAAIATDNSEPVRLHSSSSKKPSTTVSSLPSSAKVKQKTQSSKTSKKIKKSSKSNNKGDSIVKQPLSEVALAASVEQLWTDMSSQSVTQQQTYDLSCLFMTSVANNSSSPPPNEKEPNHEMRDASIITSARGEGSVWLPHSSTTNDEVHVASEKEDMAVLDQFDLPPPGNTVSSSLFQQDQFTDDSDDSDSDQTLQWEEGEGEEEREEEEDNELVRELTSMCTLTSEEGKEEEEEEEEEEGDEERVWSRMTIDDLIHDFDVYQDQVREQDESM